MRRSLRIAAVILTIQAPFALLGEAAPKAKSAIGNPDAPQGGNFSISLAVEPASLDPLSATDGAASDVQGYVLESLLSRDPETRDWRPSLAESWTASKDGKTYTFKLREKVKWQDGRDLVAEDVKFSLDAIFDDRYQGAPMRPRYENFEKVEIVDPRTVRFVAKVPQSKDLESLARLQIVPKHVYDEGKKETLAKTLVGTGPYRIDKYDRGQKLVLRKNAAWWGRGVADRKGEHNFETITIRFVKEKNVALEMFKKGDLDYVDLNGETYGTLTANPESVKKVEAIKYESKEPSGYSFIGWNLRNELFTDKRVRVALAHLMNRRLMIEKFLYGLYEPATGPWYRASEYASKKVKPIEFDPKKAAALLKEAGWTDSDHDGVLSKTINGQKRKFRFELINSSPDMAKYFTIYKEDLRKAGIDMDIKLVEWNAFIKLMDERKYEAMALSWGAGSYDWEPKQFWHSSSEKNAGYNFNYYNNPEVDRLIEKAEKTKDKKSKVATLHRVYEIIADDAPYLFFFNTKYTLYGVSKSVGRLKDTYGYGVGTTYWWKKPVSQ